MSKEQEQIEYVMRDHISPEEKDLLDGLAEIYSIIVTIDKLEKLYLKEFVDDDDYTNQATKLMTQYKTLCSDNPSMTDHFDQNIDTFVEMYNLANCSNGVQRLKKGIPATVEHFQLKSLPSTSVGNDTDPNGLENSNAGGLQRPQQQHTQKNTLDGKAVAETTGNFITLMDALKLRYNTKDQLHPLMSELLLSVNKVFNSTSFLQKRINSFKERQSLVNWIIKINHLKMGESLSEQEVKDMLFDLDQAYKGFYSLLS